MTSVLVRRSEKVLLFVMVGIFYTPVCAHLVKSFATHVLRKKGRLIARLIKGPDLHGMTMETQPVRLTPRTWFSGEYQDRLSKSFGETFALRQYSIRITNQIDYTAFNRSYMANSSLIVGKHKTLYERAYIDDYVGLTPSMPVEELDTTAQQLALLQKRLALKGVVFLLLVTPSKAAIYPEDIPDVFLPGPYAGRRNYDALVPLLNKYHIHYVDGHKITQEARVTSRWRLFPKGGTHWNSIGAYPTVKALLEQIGTLGGRPTPQVRLEAVPADNIPDFLDSDLTKLLNLMFSPKTEVYPHAMLSVDRSHCEADPGRIAFIGGSFTRVPIKLLAENHVFRQVDFYYYYRRTFQSFPGAEEGPINVGQIDWQHQMLGCKAIVLEINEASLSTGTESHYRAFMSDALRNL